MEKLLPANSIDQDEDRATLGQWLGIPKYRITQFLNLLTFPADLKVRLKKTDWVAEGHLRPFTRLNARWQRVRIERLLGVRAVAKAS
jgi:hypothetical protein